MFFFSLYIAGCTREDIGSNLFYVKSVGTGVEHYIARAAMFELYGEYLYLPDQKLAKVLQFSVDGKFIQSFGKKGRGPGEFSGKMLIGTADSLLFVTDYTNYTLSKYNINGQLVESWAIRSNHFGEFLATNNYLMTGPNIALFEREFTEKDRFYLIDQEGNQIGSLGRFPEFADGIIAGMFRSSIDIENDRVHILYLFYGIYQVYNLRGELLAEYNLENITGVKINDTYKDPATFANIKGPSSLGLLAGILPVYRGFDVSGNKVFLSRNKKGYIHIEELSISENKLSYVTEYIYPFVKRNIAGMLDFQYYPDRNSFFILEAGVPGEGFVLSEYGIK